MKFLNQLIFMGVALPLSLPLQAGELDQPNLPGTPDSGMYTLEDIYNRLDGIKAPEPHSFTPPINALPGSTDYTLTQVYDKIKTKLSEIPIDLCVQPGSQRFVNQGDGTVIDYKTCLMWLGDARCLKNKYNSSGDNQVKMTDLVNDSSCIGYANTYENWRLPTFLELESLVDYRHFQPPLRNQADDGKATNGDPFNRLPELPVVLLAPYRGVYWTSIRSVTSSKNFWLINMGKKGGAILGSSGGYNLRDFWPVRDLE